MRRKCKWNLLSTKREIFKRPIEGGKMTYNETEKYYEMWIFCCEGWCCQQRLELAIWRSFFRLKLEPSIPSSCFDIWNTPAAICHSSRLKLYKISLFYKANKRCWITSVLYFLKPGDYHPIYTLKYFLQYSISVSLFLSEYSFRLL